MLDKKCLQRVIIEGVKPELDGGRFPIKRTVGERVTVRADVFTDGHDAIAGVLKYRKAGMPEWREVPLKFWINDRWWAAFRVEELGRYQYTVAAWIDPFQSWSRDLAKKAKAGLDLSLELLVGAQLVESAADRATSRDAQWLRSRCGELRADRSQDRRVQQALEKDLSGLMARYPDRAAATTYARQLEVVVDRLRARFSAWYELFPRSCAATPGTHGTFRDCAARLPYIARMGFDVVYLPPIHPIGREYRKGPNNAPTAGPGDPGSPWAIGAPAGGHREIHPRLGTLEDFRHLVAQAKDHGLEIALDLAFQCAPDHPYVADHPEWFRKRPDGSIQYAENPPKKYQDIYPFDFDSPHWRELVAELQAVVRFWIEQGVRIFRVDNPHTKPFAFWEWLIDQIKTDYPEVIFLAEAFTRPKVTYRLAKLGFSQSYTYFAWRNTAWEIKKYFTELTQTAVHEFFRPSLWPNTPDILTEYLQTGGRPAFAIRLALAATLGASYGIYGPAFELCIDRPKEPGSEEYLDSEKYEIRPWDLQQPHSLRDLITRINRIRRENPALQSNEGLRFHPTDNDQLLCYSKHTPDRSNTVLVAVNLDPHHTHTGWVKLPLAQLGLVPGQPFQVHDLLSDARYLWQGPRNYLELNPQVAPAHILRIRRKVRTEQDFDYYL